MKVRRWATRREESSTTQPTGNAVIIYIGASEHVIGDSQLIADVEKVRKIHADKQDCATFGRWNGRHGNGFL